jgi:regulatory protein
VRRHLRRRGVDPATTARTLSALIVDGYLNDVRYAQRFTADKRQLDHWGAKRIEQRLLAAGVDVETVDAVLATRDPSDELEAAIELLERRFSIPPRDGRERNRALGLLVRRGYDLDLACDAIRAHERGDWHGAA